MSIETKENFTEKNQIKEIIEEEEENKEKKELTNDEALDIQINYLKTSTKNILDI